MFFEFQTAKGSAAVTPNNDVDLPRGGSVALWVTVSGSLSVILNDGSQMDIPSVAVGPVGLACKRVRATGTTAQMYALYAE